MAEATTFPAFLSVDFDNSRGFRDFRIEAAEAGSAVKKQFERDLADVQGVVQRAFKMPNGAFNIDTSSMRQAATEAERMAQGYRVVARAAEEAARAADDNTVATRRHIQAAQAAAREAEDEARALSAKAATYERLQAEINRTGTQLTTFAGANRRVAESQRAVQQASVGAGQQLQDIAISLYGGQKAGIVFAQQLPQLAFALSALEGSSNKTAASVGKFATFLSGPWGLAVGLGVGILATFTAGLFDNADAADVAEDAHKALEKRLSDMSTFFDLATGAINRQNEALIANARLKRLDEIDALKGTQKDRATEINRLVVSSGAERFENAGSIADPIIRSIGRDSTIIDAINTNKGNQKAISDALLTIARSGSENAGKARRILDLRGEAFSANADVRDLSLEEESLASGRLAKELRKGQKTPHTRTNRGSAGRELRAAQAIEDAVDQASNAVARLRGEFDQAPKDIDKAAAAINELEVLTTKLDRRAAGGKLTAAEKAKEAETRRQIEELQKVTIPAFKQRPIEDRIKAGERELELQRLVLGGRQDEADVLSFQYDIMRQLGVETEEQLRKELKGRDISYDRYLLLVKQREEIIAMQKAQERLDRAGFSVAAQLREIDGLRGSIENAIAQAPKDAAGAVKGLIGNITSQFRQLSARQLTDRLFGDVFDDLENELRSKSPVGRATRDFVEGSAKATDALGALTAGFERLNASLPAPANDNVSNGLRSGMNALLANFPISVNGSRSGAASPFKTAPLPQGLSAGDLYQTTFTRLFERYLGKGAPLARDLGSIFQGYLEAGPLGAGVKGLSALFGSSSGVGKALASLSENAPVIGAIMEAQSAIGSLLGNDEIKNGKLLNHIIGPFATALFGSAKRGSASISGNGDDFAVAVRGNTGKYKEASSTAADSVIGSIERIAEQLGGSVDPSRGNVSIGIRKGKYRVDPTGAGRTKAKKGVLDFGDDAEAAARAAMLDLINDGVIQGLKAGTQRLIQAGKDLDAQLQKALDFESVFTRLKEIDDPVGAALDTLDKEFQRLQKIFTEAGASAAEYADLERLYGLERAKAIEEAVSRVAGSLKDLYGELTVGGNGKSLRDRLSAAQSEYDPLKARVAAGDRSAYDAFAKASQDLLGIQREFSGSQSPYFALLEEVTQLTKSAIDRETNIVSIATGRDTPFTSTGAVNQTYQPVVSAIDRTNDILIAGFRQLALAAGSPAGEPGFLLARML